MDSHLLSQQSSGGLTEASSDINRFRELTARTTTSDDAPLAGDIQHNIPLYDGHFVNSAAVDTNSHQALLSE